MVVVSAGEFLHEADALAAGLEFLDSGGSGGRDGGEGVEGRSVISNGEDKFRGSRGAFDGNGLVWLAAVAVAHDVGERFFKAELDGELGVSGDGVTCGQRLGPGPDPGKILELTFEGQLRLGPGRT